MKNKEVFGLCKEIAADRRRRLRRIDHADVIFGTFLREPAIYRGGILIPREQVMCFLEVELNKMLPKFVIGELVHLMVKHTARKLAREIAEHLRIRIAKIQ